MPKVGMGPIRTAQVTAAARRCIAQWGFDATTIRQIAAVAGVSTGTINHYFANKEEALNAALLDVTREFTEKMKKVLATGRDPWDRIAGFVEMSLPRTPADVEDWHIWLEVWTQSTRKRELNQVNEGIYRHWRQIVIKNVKTGIASGQFKPCDPERVAATLVALIDGCAIQCILGDPGMTAEIMHRVCIGYLQDSLLKEAHP